MGALDEILGKTPIQSTENLINNWQTAFVWLVLGIVIFALITLLLGFRRVSKGEHVNKGMLTYVKWPLLFASAGFNVFFTYYVFLPAGQPVAIFSAGVMGGVNLAEAYLVRLIIATWRHHLKIIFPLALALTLPVFAYSLMAASSSFSTMMKKNKDTMAASQLELQSAQDRIGQAQAQVQEAQIGAEKGNMLNALYQTEIRNSRGTPVSFGRIKSSCDSGGWYAKNYPEICNQYRTVSNGIYTASNVAQANIQALATSAQEKLRMAQIIKDRPPEITPTLLGFGLGIGMVGFIVSLALESAIIGVGFFEELFIKPTPLPGIVSFMNKALDWDADTITQRGLQVDISPSPGTVNFSRIDAYTNPFHSVKLEPQTMSVSAPQHLPGTSKDKASATAQDTSTQPSRQAQSVSAQAEERAGEGQANMDLSVMKERLERATIAGVGDLIECVYCSKETLKRIDTKKFCSKKCRNDFRKVAKPKG